MLPCRQACGGADAKIYSVKRKWVVVKTFSDMPKKGVLSVGFGADAARVFVGAADHNLRVFGLDRGDGDDNGVGDPPL